MRMLGVAARVTASRGFVAYPVYRHMLARPVARARTPAISGRAILDIQSATGLLELCEGKFSCRVLRGGVVSNGASFPDR